MRKLSYSEESTREVNLCRMAMLSASHTLPANARVSVKRVSTDERMLQAAKNIRLRRQHFLVYNLMSCGGDRAGFSYY